MPVKITAVSMSNYEGAVDADYGFCAECRAFTTAGCEPDARRYECEECGEKAVYGAEEALIMGLIDVSGEDDDDLD